LNVLFKPTKFAGPSSPFANPEGFSPLFLEHPPLFIFLPFCDVRFRDLKEFHFFFVSSSSSALTLFPPFHFFFFEVISLDKFSFSQIFHLSLYFFFPVLLVLRWSFLFPILSLSPP